MSTTSTALRSSSVPLPVVVVIVAVVVIVVVVMAVAVAVAVVVVVVVVLHFLVPFGRRRGVHGSPTVQRAVVVRVVLPSAPVIFVMGAESAGVSSFRGSRRALHFASPFRKADSYSSHSLRKSP
jgi:hypothetical protein